MTASDHRILDAAFDLFARRGYTAVSTSDIARRAHVNESTLFRHFKSKAAIADAVMADNINPEVERSAADSIAKSKDIASAVKIAASYYAHAFSGKFVRFQITAALELPSAFRFRTAVVRVAFYHFIVEQQRKKKLRGVDALNAARMLPCAIWGLALMKSFHLNTMRAPKIADVDTFADIWIQGMLQKSTSSLASEEN